MVTYSELIRSPEVAAARPVLAEVAATIADRQVQNRGTVGGNVCVNDPTNHLPPLFSAMGATFTILGPGGERTVSADEFFLGVYLTAVGEGELLTRVTRARARGRQRRRDGGRHARRARHLHRERRRDRRARAACASRSAACPACPSARRRSRSALRGRRARRRTRCARRSPASATRSIRPRDVHAPADYRRRLAEVCCERAVLAAAKRAKG